MINQRPLLFISFLIIGIGYFNFSNGQYKSNVISDSCRILMEDYERRFCRMYDNDGANTTTIGIGHVIHPGKIGTDSISELPFKDGITEAQIDSIFRKDVNLRINCMNKKGLIIKNQNQFDAILMFHFNTNCLNKKAPVLLGVLQDANRTEEEVAVQIRKWVNVRTQNGNYAPSKGLILRREDEVEVFKGINYIRRYMMP